MPLPAAQIAPIPLPPPPPTPTPRSFAPTLCISLLSIFYFASAALRAARDPLWYDELLTFHAASLLPSVRALWAFLKPGLENNPPLSFILAAASQALFGPNEFALRLPSIVAFWIMALCLYTFLRRRLPWPFALAGMLLPFLMGAARYSHEARPYALLLALAAIALVAWQTAAAEPARHRTRRLALVSLALALAAALCTQPLAVTLVLPFLAGEIARTIARKRVDWPVWCAFAAAAPALLVLWGLRTGGATNAHSRFTGTFLGHVYASYRDILGLAIAPLLVAGVLMFLMRAPNPAPTGTPPRPAPRLRPWELAALLGFALIPLVAVPVSSLGGHYWTRYALPCAIGLAGLAAAFFSRIAARSLHAGTALVLILAAFFAIGRFLPEGMLTDGGVLLANSSREIQSALEQIPPDEPIAIGPLMTFVELEHYSSPALASRLYYLTAPEANAAIDGDTAFEFKGPLLAQYFPFRAHFADYRAFLATHKRFYVVRPIRNLARECLAGRLNLQPLQTPNRFEYYQASPR